jgi:hypothetical protein
LSVKIECHDAQLLRGIDGAKPVGA